jgi:hypothetical protein
MLSVFMLSVVMLSVAMLSVTAPLNTVVRDKHFSLFCRTVDGEKNRR